MNQPAPSAYKGLLMSFDSLLREITSLTKCAAPYLTQETTSIVLPQWKSALESFRDSTDAPSASWQIPIGTPIQTLDSTGYDRNTGRAVFARISCVWELEKVRDPKKKRAGRWSSKACCLKGLASTQVTLFERSAQDFTTLAMWTFEVGDGSQGTHFHTQVKVDGGPPFPAWLPVPRLPTVIVTPMDVLDFVLSELFQQSWGQHLAGHVGEAGIWDSEQKTRLVKLLDWHSTCARSSGSTAWHRIKNARPELGLLGANA